jgi:hypothetical protein
MKSKFHGKPRHLFFHSSSSRIRLPCHGQSRCLPFLLWDHCPTGTVSTSPSTVDSLFYFIIHMCIQVLGHFSPLPPPPNCWQSKILRLNLSHTHFPHSLMASHTSETLINSDMCLCLELCVSRACDFDHVWKWNRFLHILEISGPRTGAVCSVPRVN